MSTGLLVLTVVHTAISLLAIGSGFVVLVGMLAGERLDRWTAFFLTTTIFTSATGFLFPVQKLLPSHVVGILSLLLLALALIARYGKHLAGLWRKVYVVTAVVSLYLNVFVLVAQAFQKIPPLRALAPTQDAAPFKITQLVVLLLFVYFTIRALRGFRQPAASPA
jgi:hypothetical protein